MTTSKSDMAARCSLGATVARAHAYSAHSFSAGGQAFVLVSYGLRRGAIHEGLTIAEDDVLRRLMQGDSKASIAGARGTSTNTVANQVAALCRKLGVGSRRELLLQGRDSPFRRVIAPASRLVDPLRALALRTEADARDDRVTTADPALHAGEWVAVDQFALAGRYCVLAWTPSEAGAGPWLTTRERQVLALSSEGRTNKAIAGELGLAPGTVGALLARVASKCRSAVSAASAALEGRQGVAPSVRRDDTDFIFSRP